MSFYLALLFSKSEEYCMFRQILFPQQSVRKISRAYLEWTDDVASMTDLPVQNAMVPFPID